MCLNLRPVQRHGGSVDPNIIKTHICFVSNCSCLCFWFAYTMGWINKSLCLMLWLCCIKQKLHKFAFMQICQAVGVFLLPKICQCNVNYVCDFQLLVDIAWLQRCTPACCHACVPHVALFAITTVLHPYFVTSNLHIFVTACMKRRRPM